MASIVARIRGWSAGMKPTIAIMRLDGVELVAAERLGERADVVVPARGS